VWIIGTMMIPTAFKVSMAGHRAAAVGQACESGEETASELTTIGRLAAPYQGEAFMSSNGADQIMQRASG
jgi:hypothetical protein